MTHSTPKPPLAAVRPHPVVSPHGTRIDPYYWLRDDERKDPDVLAHIAAENAYRSALMAPTQGLQDALYAEILGRLKQDDSTVPYAKNGYWYSVRYETGQEHPIFVRRKGTLEAPEEILLNANSLAAGHDYFQIGAMAVSPNGQYLAFCEDTVGRRQFTLRFKNLSSGQLEETPIGNVEPDIVWAADNRTVLYVEKDPETLLGVYVKKHELGSCVEDELVFEQTDLSFYTGVGKSKSDAYLFIHMQSTTSSEWRYAKADDPKLKFNVFLAHESDHEYDLEHSGDAFVVRSNWRAENFRVVAASIAPHSDRTQWREVIPHRAEVLLEDVDVFDDFIALSVRSGGLSKIAIKHWRSSDALASGREYFIDSDEAAYSMGVSVNPQMDSHKVRYVYSSLTTPTSVYDYDVDSGEKQLLKRDPVLGEFDPAKYATEFIFVTARDGTALPVSLVYARGFKRDGSAPLLQYGYGAYGISMEPSFSSSRLSLLDRGFVFALAHVRGGQEMGRAWYDNGRLLHKKNSFTDFIDITQALVARGYGATDKIFAMGGSAGGLLMGAIANMGASHYRGLVAQVPFVDVVTTMLDDSIPLTSNEYEEWGNPTEAKYYEYMSSYSPYDNVTAQAYPAMLITTGLWDSQVQYYEPVKWVAKLRAQKTDERVLLLHVEMEAGHGGKSGRFQRYREIAMEYAFLLEQAGIRK
jgi:oligopeptidase B